MGLQLHLRPLPRALRYQLKYFISRSCGACGVLDQHIVKHLASLGHHLLTGGGAEVIQQKHR